MKSPRVISIVYVIGGPSDTSSFPKFVDQRNVENPIPGLSNQFDPIRVFRGDTLVYIGPPPKAIELISWHFSQLHQLSSSSIKTLQSKKLDDLIGPKSIRSERRLRKDGVISNYNTEFIKYFVDLRPPNEEEEAVILLTELTCTRGILTWHRALAYFGLPTMLVCGKDRFGTATVSRKTVALSEGISASGLSSESRNNLRVPEILSKVANGQADAQIEMVDDAMEPEYSPLRHRSALERLLQAIVHNDPRLDSAPKMWTFFALAKYFQCATHERINGWITKWILSDANINFIQCNPEVAFRIGMGIESPVITRDAFSILVGEKALWNVCSEADPYLLTSFARSVHGRYPALLDEDERNRIDHAASSLVRRIPLIFEGLITGEMAWLRKSREYKKLVEFESCNDSEETIVTEAIRLIKDYVRGRICSVLCRDEKLLLPGRRAKMKLVGEFMYGMPEDFAEIYNTLNQRMRLFTRTFWRSLSQEKFDLGDSSLFYLVGSEESPGNINSNHLLQDMIDNYSSDPGNGIREIKRRDLFKAAGRFNGLLSKIYLQHSRDVHGTSVMEESHPAASFRCDSNEVQPSLTCSSALPSLDKPGNEDNIVFDGLLVSSPKRSPEPGPTLPSPGKRRRVSVVLRQSNDPLCPAYTSHSIPIRGGKPMEEFDVFEDGRETFEVPTVLGFSQSREAEDETRVRRELALHAELFRVAQIQQESSFPGQGIADLFEEFEPVYEYNRTSGRLELREFRDRTQPEAEPLQLPQSTNLDQFPPMMKERLLETGESSRNQALRTQHLHAITDERQAPSIPRHSGYRKRSLNEAASISPTTFRPPVLEVPPPNRYVDICKMLSEITEVLHGTVFPIVCPPHLFLRLDPLPIDLTDSLCCLEEDEWKYLPLWCPGGCDDGTGGVFDEMYVPNLEKGGFRGGKRGIGNVAGTPLPSSTGDDDSNSASSFSEIDSSEANTTVGRMSHRAARGTDGGTTAESVRSLGDEASDLGFMEQKELWEEIQNMKVKELQLVRSSQVDRGKGKGRADDWEDGETSTVRHANSDIDITKDIQGDMFGDIDDDDAENDCGYENDIDTPDDQQDETEQPDHAVHDAPPGTKETKTEYEEHAERWKAEEEGWEDCIDWREDEDVDIVVKDRL